MTDYQYEERIILFADILGTKSLTEQTKSDNGLLNKIIQILDYITKYIKDTESSDIKLINNNEYKISYFSDSFVFSIKFKEDDLFLIGTYIVRILDLIIQKFLEIGVLIRGGITFGDVIHTDNILFGPGLVEAYELESIVAKYPRIIFSEKLLNKIELCYDNYMGEIFTNELLCLRKDKDNILYFDYIDSIHLSRPEVKLIYMFSLLKSLENMNNNQNLIEKHKWLKEKIIDCYGNFNYDIIIRQFEKTSRYTLEDRINLKKCLNGFLSEIEALKKPTPPR